VALYFALSSTLESKENPYFAPEVAKQSPWPFEIQVCIPQRVSKPTLCYGCTAVDDSFYIIIFHYCSKYLSRTQGWRCMMATTGDINRTYHPSGDGRDIHYFISKG
jgi:hypothetical protein